MTLVLRLMGHSIGNRNFREDDKPKNTVQKLTYSIPHSRVKNHVNK